MNKITVVIPYFQRDKGILNLSLRSIDKQTHFAHILEVIIVDDGSPAPSNDELFELSTNLINKIQIIYQPNQGVSKARNTGLSNVSADCQYIAFLDSDDIWIEDHINAMVQAFDLGATFYFSNFCQPEQSVGAFERGGKFTLLQHQKCNDTVYRYQGDMLEQILTGNLIGTSTVGFSWQEFSTLRFREDLKFAGEDYLFWLDIASREAKIMFSPTCTVKNGLGVNIFASAKWGTKHLQQRLVDELQFRKTALTLYQLGPTTVDNLQHRIFEIRKTLLKNGLSLLKQLKLITVLELIGIITKDPAILRAALRSDENKA